jgi:uroporphyrinogen decarboxylase
MLKTGKQAGGFGGLRVVSLESRRAREMADIIASFGGEPLVAPSMREVPLEENAAAFAFAERLFAGEIDLLLCLTGVGTRALAEVIASRYGQERFVQALRATTVVARGPKPVKALRELGVTEMIAVPEPNTWRQVLETLDAHGLPRPGSRVAVQEYGVTNPELLRGLEERGAEIVRVPVYRWSLPEDLEPLRAAIRALIDGSARVLLATSATQVHHLLQVATEMGVAQRLRDALARAVVASIGPVCSDALREEGLPVHLEPEHPRMGHLVKAAADQALALLGDGVLNPSPQPPPRNGEGEHSPLAGVRQEASVADQPEPGRLRHPSPFRGGAGGGVNPQGGAGGGVNPQPPWHDSPFMKACRREPAEVTPVWLMRQAGRYMREYRELRSRVGFLELCRTPELVAEVTVTAAERIGADAAILFADILLIVEPLGLKLAFTKGEGPSIEPPIRQAADVDRLQEADPVALSYVYDAVRATRAALSPRVPLIGFAGAPFTIASYMIEGAASRNFEETKLFMLRDPGAWNALMARIARGLAGYLNRQIEAGAQAVQLFDSWVGCLSPADYREFVLPHSRAVIQGVRPGVPVIHFGTGTATLLPDMKAAGGDVIGLDWRVELDDGWSLLGPEVGVQGNLDPVVLLADRATIRERARRILAQAGGRPGHIFNLGHGILPQTPVENAIALIDAVHELSERRHVA